jgi:SAM-dependent methyltransferase
MHDKEIIYRVDGYDIVDCHDCGFIHCMPIPDTRELYIEKYHTEQKPDYFRRIEDDLEWWNRIYDERLNLFGQMLFWTRRRLLDVGSGSGYFLKRAMEKGWFAVGIEPSESAWNHSKGMGLNVLNGYFDQFAPVNNRYDVIHMHEVLEHVEDPAHTLELAHESLNVGGILCVVVPNDFNKLQTGLADYHFLAPPWHINYFNRESLGQLFYKTGFTVEDVQASFPMELFIYMGHDYRGNDELGRECHRWRMRLEEQMEPRLRHDLYDAFCKMGVGRDLMMIGRKA